MFVFISGFFIAKSFQKPLRTWRSSLLVREKRLRISRSSNCNRSPYPESPLLQVCPTNPCTTIFTLHSLIHHRTAIYPETIMCQAPFQVKTNDE